MSRFEVGGEELVVLSFPRSVAGIASLSRAEREVAVLVLEGLTNLEIARRRGTSARTVANQIASIYDKLGVSSRIELVAALGCANDDGE
jgi:DNA-binding CsgD family transcriptional regulator